MTLTLTCNTCFLINHFWIKLQWTNIQTRIHKSPRRVFLNIRNNGTALKQTQTKIYKVQEIIFSKEEIFKPLSSLVHSHRSSFWAWAQTVSSFPQELDPRRKYSCRSHHRWVVIPPCRPVDYPSWSILLRSCSGLEKIRVETTHYNYYYCYSMYIFPVMKPHQWI